jgi:hypothetical protein
VCLVLCLIHMWLTWVCNTWGGGQRQSGHGDVGCGASGCGTGEG